MANKKISDNCVKLVKKYEGFRAKAYYDVVGVITIGYGTTNADKSITGVTIKSGMSISEEKACEWLEKSLNKKYLPLVLKYDDKYNWNQNQLDALVSFCYNIGSIDQLTAKGTRSVDTIADKILEYTKAGGVKLRGLVRRRREERELFVTPVEGGEEVKKKEGCFSSNKKAKNLKEFLHNRNYGAGEKNLRAIASENYENLTDAMFDLACSGDLRKPERLNRWKDE